MSNETKKKIETTKKENKGNKNLIYRILFVVFTVGFFICIGLMGYKWWAEKKAQENFENLLPTETEYVEETETEMDILDLLGITVPEKNINWDELKASNEHIYAWIYIPNTNVDYPILQHPTNDAYYLDHNLDGSSGLPGCIYTEHRYNTTDWTDFNTLIYGHNMKNGTMFKTLHNFEDSAFFEENRYMYIYTPDHVYVYDIFAAYVYGDEHILAKYNQDSEAARQEYIDNIFDIRDMSAHFRDGVEITTESNLVTLVTCIGGRPNNRYLVQGVLVNPPIVEEVQ